MIHSLRFKLLAVVLTISAIAIGIVGFLSSRVTSTEFQRFVTTEESSGVERAGDILIEHYEINSNWSDVQGTLDRIAGIADRRLVLLDPKRNIIATSPGEMKSSLAISPNNQFTLHIVEHDNGRVLENVIVLVNPPHVELISKQGEPVGTLYSIRTPQEGPRGDPGFLRSVNRPNWNSTGARWPAS